MTTESPNAVKATETSLLILETLKDLDGAGVTEVATELDIPKSTVHNHLSTLHNARYIIKKDGKYYVGLRFLEFGEHTRNRKRIYEAARPEIENLAEKTGELANLAVEEHGQGVYLYQSKGQQSVSTDVYAGMRSNLHCTALGKAILSEYPRERVDNILDRHGLPERTKNTITDRDALYEELDEVKERGYAYDIEERLRGLRCVAAPITTNDQVYGAISVSGPTNRMQTERFHEEIPEMLLNAENVIELDVTFS
ncbi:IclR family transcriptional regulator [Haloplanus halophilus]|uniref:IclR family transcriptional regulator n=1 Tax=Haloplanus halophilus TaxID=2949993 RepID=UPI00203DBFDD|nr:IclR family transcriptional regulator [Haloplanus sp. GDY1]